MKFMEQGHRGVIGSLLAWMGTAWAYFETHYAPVAAAFAVLVSIFTLANIARGWMKKDK